MEPLIIAQSIWEVKKGFLSNNSIYSTIIADGFKFLYLYLRIWKILLHNGMVYNEGELQSWSNHMVSYNVQENGKIDVLSFVVEVKIDDEFE